MEDYSGAANRGGEGGDVGDGGGEGGGGAKFGGVDNGGASSNNPLNVQPPNAAWNEAHSSGRNQNPQNKMVFGMCRRRTCCLCISVFFIIATTVTGVTIKLINIYHITKAIQ
ncbi:protein no-on-transient A-like [Hyalella azteca]|uniref:Protein no-on-transient A-like n=1 Tax=Hyalella azteca TaxID=294128 RepID=A0A979FJD7_HYAAZ|nr:protein no-on-transient A-like [Hyalella azteca]